MTEPSKELIDAAELLLADFISGQKPEDEQRAQREFAHRIARFADATARQRIESLRTPAPLPPTCVLTGSDSENPDDCTTHEHEEPMTVMDLLQRGEYDARLTCGNRWMVITEFFEGRPLFSVFEKDYRRQPKPIVRAVDEKTAIFALAE